MDNKNEIKESLPMNWWNFWKYFRFPVGIFFSIFNFIGSLSMLKDVQLNIYGILLLVINFGLIIFLCITFYFFVTRKKHGFEILITYSIAEIVFNSFINTFSNSSSNVYSTSITELVITALIISGIFCVIWVYPNYIYFKKRKHLFGQDEEQERNDEQKSDKEFSTIPDSKETIEDKKEIINEEIKQEINDENKKYCTKCGKQIEKDWLFCNYCGNKLK